MRQEEQGRTRGRSPAARARRAGLTLHPDGSITGTPTSVGTFPFTAQVADGIATATHGFSITIAPPALVVLTNSLPPGEAGAAYSASPSATGGSPPYTWSITGLPAGLTFSPSTGAITGPLSASATTSTSVVITVTDSTPTSANSPPLTLTVTSGPGITTVSPLPSGEVTAPYSQTLAASGGTNTGFTWTVTSGSPPAGLSLSAGGVISGTPTAAGPTNFTVRVTDSAGGVDQKGFALNIIGGPGITTPAGLPPGETSSPYSQTLAASGGTNVGFTWSITAGSVPGLSLSPGGVLSGTPTTIGLFNFTAKVTDSGGGSASQVFALNITGGLSITTPASLPAGEATAPYSQTLAVSGGTNTGFTWTITAGSLPLGLSLSAAGAITGTPTTTGLSSFTAKVTDSGGGSASQAFTLNIIGGPAITTASPLPQGEVTASYSQSLAASGGTATGFTWTVTTGSLPSGLSLSAAGAITGTPTAAGPSNFTVQVTDSAGGKASQPFALTIIAGPSITTSATLPKGEVSAAYSLTLSASGGSAAGFVWSLAGGSLPAGLSLTAAGVLSGTPTAAALGTDSFTVRVTDSANGAATLALSITIVAGPTITTAPVLPNGTVGVAYTRVTLAAADGTQPYVWSITQGSLPQGLSLDANAGTITGTPTTSGASNFTVQINDGKGVTATKQFRITIAAGLTITSAPGLPNATTGVSYSVTVLAAGGSPPYTWSVTAGSLPTGLTLNSTTGAISGIPSSSGAFPFTLQVTDSASVTATKPFALNVAQALAITTAATLPSGAVGTPYSLVLSAVGGTSPYAFTIIAGALPSGLSLGASAGLISGTPASSGTFTFTVQVKDSNSVVASQAFSLTVVSGLAITTNSQLPQGALNSPYSQTLAAAGGTAPYTWNLAQGSLPAGLSLTVAGVITGTPRNNGTSTFSVQVKDSVSATATKLFTLTIAAGLTITSGAALPQGTIGVVYPALTLAAVGGAQPYTWSVSAGSLAPGLSLSSNGIITGTPSTAGAFDFTLQVKDNNGTAATLAFTISIVPLSLPQVNVAGMPQTSPAGQQISFGLSLASGYPVDVTGQITLSFQPDAVAPAVDPALQFSTGGLTANYTIPANSTKAVQIALQTGTVSGTITLSFTLAAGGSELRDFQNTITIPRAAPAIQSVKLVRTSAGLEVHVVGFSSSRDLTEADLTFTAAPGATLQTTKLTEKLASVATAWYKSAASAQYGSQFMLVLPFTASQGSVDAVGSVSVVLKNAEGSSQSASGTL